MIQTVSRSVPRVLLAAALLAACGPAAVHPEYSAAEGRGEPSSGDDRAAPAAADEVPHGRLPEGVTPTEYSLWIEVVPSRDRFRGRVNIRVELAAAQSLIWLHGRDLNVTEAEVLPEGLDPVSARYEQVDEEGVAALRLESPVGPGEVEISLTYDAPFDRQLKGLYRVDTGGDSYAFTQFEATSARLAFPCFDEPRFKTPFELTMAVSPEHVAIANTAEADRQEVSGMLEVRFARTERLPTYLVAMAVGPLDVVEHAPIPANDVRSRPLPFRGIAARGRGARLATMLEETGAILADLEEYFGVEYPYDKLDIIAVPDFASGAMENAGAITFREELLLLDPDNAPEAQRRAAASVMAHELAHQWFGNLVTMPWWDDIWLNEAFATWMGNKVLRHVYPQFEADVSMVDSVHYAMHYDSLTSARQIRQPIDTNHDIRNAFDAITYRKGGGVLEMFERSMGEETFREGIREYINRHRWGTATADDLLDALSQAAGRDVGTAFNTFLMQPGVPLIEASRECGDDGAFVRIRQSRYLPVGSTGEADATWQVPVCVRHGRGRQTDSLCEMVTEPEARIRLGDACPDWVMPNADAAGYYRWTLPPEGLQRLQRAGWSRLTNREKLSVADNLAAAFDANALPAAAVFRAFDPIAADASRIVATTPMRLIEWTRQHLFEGGAREPVARFAERLYGRRARRLGWSAGRREDGETGLLRASVLDFMVDTAESASVRRDAATRGRRYIGFGGDGELHEDAVEANLVSVALTAAVQESDAAFFDALVEQALASEDAMFRRRALGALAHARDPALSDRVLALTLDERVRVNEVTTILHYPFTMPETRARAWDWLREHFDEVYARVATTRAGAAPWMTSRFCSEERAAEVEAFFGARIEALPGGPRNLAGALEAIRLCAAQREAQAASAREFFNTAP